LKFYYHEPKQKKKDKKHEEADTIPPPIEFLKLQAATSAQHEIYNPVIIKTETPIAEFNKSGVHLELQTDTVWNVIPSNPIHRYVGDTLLMLSMDMTWQPGRKYRLTVDSTAVHDAYGLFNDKFVHEFTVKKPEDYSNLKFTISGPDTTDVVVELLDASDRPVRRVDRDRVSGEAKFTNVTPGTYYARLYLDSNSNGKWDTGNVAEHLQPEEVYYYNAKLELKANWDVEQTWNIYDVAIDMQKPWAIKKNKPKLKKGERAPGQPEDEDEEDDGWGTSTSGNRKNSNNSNSFGGLGGIQKINNLTSGTISR
jgi:hypothetical protein